MSGARMEQWNLVEMPLCHLQDKCTLLHQYYYVKVNPNHTIFKILPKYRQERSLHKTLGKKPFPSLCLITANDSLWCLTQFHQDKMLMYLSDILPLTWRQKIFS